MLKENVIRQMFDDLKRLLRTKEQLEKEQKDLKKRLTSADNEINKINQQIINS